MKKRSVIADKKLLVERIKGKREADFNRSLFVYKSNTFKSQSDNNFSSNQLDKITWSKLGSRLDLSLVSFVQNVLLFN